MNETMNEVLDNWINGNQETAVANFIQYELKLSDITPNQLMEFDLNVFELFALADAVIKELNN